MGPFDGPTSTPEVAWPPMPPRLGPAYERMGAQPGQRDEWTPDLVAAVTEQRRRLLPLDRWRERVRWRDERLMRLRRFLDQQDGS